MTDKKISALTASNTPLAGTEVLPIVQGGSTVKVSVDNLTAGRVVSASGAAVNATFKAWDVVSAFQVGTGASFGGGVGFADGFATCNSYYDGSTWRRIVATGASQIALTPAAGLKFNIAGTGAANSTITWTEAGSFSALTDFTLNTGNLVIGTAGKGIDFSSDSHAAGMTSELLNDYEEGTFTPTIVGYTSAGTATYVRQLGYYTKVGNRVTFSIDVVWNSGTGTGDLGISGLPFATSSVSMLKNFTVLGDGIALTAGSYLQGANSGISATTLYINQSATGSATMSAVPYDAAGQLVVSGQYFI